MKYVIPSSNIKPSTVYGSLHANLLSYVQCETEERIWAFRNRFEEEVIDRVNYPLPASCDQVMNDNLWTVIFFTTST